MFREMRRVKQLLPEEESRRVLAVCTSGVLALDGDEGYPYAVPLSYVYDGGRLLFHSARQGHKLDAIGGGAKASFCVIERDEVKPEDYTTLYRSVVVFGRVRVVEDEGEARLALLRLADKYSPGREAESRALIEAELPHLRVLELTVEHLTGKEGRALAQARRG